MPLSRLREIEEPPPPPLPTGPPSHLLSRRATEAHEDSALHQPLPALLGHMKELLEQFDPDTEIARDGLESVVRDAAAAAFNTRRHTVGATVFGGSPMVG